MKIEDVKKSTVKHNNRIVEYLAELKNGNIAFQYDDEWLKNRFSISPFSLPLTKALQGTLYFQYKGKSLIEYFNLYQRKQ